MNEPSPTAFNGRGPGGKFGPGNKAGKGNPLNKRAQQIRATLMKEATPKRMRFIVLRLLKMAAEGDLAAIRELFDRTIGRAASTDVLERIENLETLLNEREANRGLE